jgi:hypothetical protein
MKCLIREIPPERFANPVCLEKLCHRVAVGFQVPYWHNRLGRLKREPVDHGLSVAPTKEWQDSLSQRLALAGASGGALHTAIGYPDMDTAPPAQRRRLNAHSVAQTTVPDWNNLYTIDPTTGLALDSMGGSIIELVFDRR